jgi:hypothetical protein
MAAPAWRSAAGRCGFGWELPYEGGSFAIEDDSELIEAREPVALWNVKPGSAAESAQRQSLVRDRHPDRAGTTQPDKNLGRSPLERDIPPLSTARASLS